VVIWILSAWVKLCMMHVKVEMMLVEVFSCMNNFQLPG
jgi:hypothetical protein